MRIDIVSSSRDVFGSDRAALRLAHVLDGLGATVRLVLPEQRPEHGLTALARDEGIDVATAKVTIVSSRGFEQGLPALVPARGPAADIAIHNTSAVVGFSGSARRRVTMLREWLEPTLVRHRLLAKLHAKRNALVVGISRDVVRQWHRCVSPSPPVRLTHDWLDDELLDALSADGAEQREGILCLGRFNQWKGQEVLADAYESAFPADQPRPSLTFLGAEGANTPFADQAERLKRRAAKHGWIVAPVTPDPGPALRGAALVVVPSLRPEPFGLVILEALAAGARVLAFDGGGPSDMANDLSPALRLAARSPADLAAGLRTWWDEGGLPQTPEMRGRTHEMLRERYSPRRAAEDWRAHLDLLSDGRSP